MKEVEGINFLKWMYVHLKQILIVQAIALILSIVFSSPYFIPEEYKSTCIVYPNNLWEYSHETPTEQMMEFLNSVDVKNEVIEKFNLRKHYDLLYTEPYFKKLYKKYDDNVDISPTQYNAVDITVYDISPDTAYEMVTSLLDFLNDKIKAVQHEKSMELVAMWKKALSNKQREIDSMTNRSKQLSSEYGLFDYTMQSKEISKAYYEALTNGKSTKQLDELNKQMKNLEEHGIEFQTNNEHIKSAITNYTAIETKYEDVLKDINNNLTYWSYVSAPYKPDNSYYPNRFLIIICTCLTAFIFSILVIGGIEKSKQKT